MKDFAPTEEWIEAFEAQATDELYERATRYATSRAEGVARSGGAVDDLYVLALVQDAFTDTLCGVLAWDPEAASLEQQVITAIRSRSRHDREHARRFRRVRIESVTAEVEVALRADEAAEAEHEAAERVAALRALAGDDTDVVRILDAMCEGATTRSEIMAETGLSTKRYRNARWRLAGLVKQQTPKIPWTGERA
jgi:hypothetical protein